MAGVKYALVLSGGGFKGAFQIGALRYIMEHGITHKDGTVTLNPKFDVIAGVSVGALNGAFMAMEDFEGLKQLWDDVSTNGSGEIYTSDLVEINGAKVKPKFNSILRKLIPHSFFQSIFELIFDKNDLLDEIGDNFDKIKSLADSTPLLNKLKANVRRNKLKVPFRMGFTSLVNGVYYAPYAIDFKTDDDLCKGILASAALPIVFAPVEEVAFKDPQTGREIVAKQVTDGGTTNISPLQDVIDYIKTHDSESDYHIIIINCSPKEDTAQDKSFNIGEYAFRVTNDLLTSEVLKNDTETFLMINDLVEQASVSGLTLKGPDGRDLIKFKYKLIQPNNPNEIGEDTGDTLDSRPGTLSFREAKGFEIAQKAMTIIPPSGDWS